MRFVTAKSWQSPGTPWFVDATDRELDIRPRDETCEVCVPLWLDAIGDAS